MPFTHVLLLVGRRPGAPSWMRPSIVSRMRSVAVVCTVGKRRTPHTVAVDELAPGG